MIERGSHRGTPPAAREPEGHREKTNTELNCFSLCPLCPLWLHCFDLKRGLFARGFLADFGEDFFEFADGNDDPDTEDEQADGFDDGGGWVHVTRSNDSTPSPRYCGETAAERG